MSDIPPGYGSHAAHYQDLPTAALVQEVLARWEPSVDEPCDTALPFLVALHERADRSVFDAAADLIALPDRRERLLGLRILRELGHPESRPMFPETWELLEMLCQIEEDPEILAWALQCFYWMRKPRALRTMLAFATHPEARVRDVVAGGLDPEDKRAREALLQLCDDPDPDVRWSALFEVKEHILDDTSEIFDLLLRRSGDSSDAVRELADEALLRRSRSPRPPG
ncbi:hypothetical protein DYH09_28700 [bacterium CPR1]|nr:hypothetical protein [bacterium CPR1]